MLFKIVTPRQARVIHETPDPLQKKVLFWGRGPKTPIFGVQKIDILGISREGWGVSQICLIRHSTTWGRSIHWYKRFWLTPRVARDMAKIAIFGQKGPKRPQNGGFGAPGARYHGSRAPCGVIWACLLLKCSELHPESISDLKSAKTKKKFLTKKLTVLLFGRPRAPKMAQNGPETVF